MAYDISQPWTGSPEQIAWVTEQLPEETANAQSMVAAGVPGAKEDLSRFAANQYAIARSEAGIDPKFAYSAPNNSEFLGISTDFWAPIIAMATAVAGSGLASGAFGGATGAGTAGGGSGAMDAFDAMQGGGMLDSLGSVAAGTGSGATGAGSGAMDAFDAMQGAPGTVAEALGGSVAPAAETVPQVWGPEVGSEAPYAPAGTGAPSVPTVPPTGGGAPAGGLPMPAATVDASAAATTGGTGTTSLWDQVLGLAKAYPGIASGVLSAAGGVGSALLGSSANDKKIQAEKDLLAEKTAQEQAMLNYKRGLIQSGSYFDSTLPFTVPAQQKPLRRPDGSLVFATPATSTGGR